MDFELNQTAVYWAFSSVDGWGVITIADPVEVDVRWEDKQVLFRNVDGQEIMSEARVYLNQDVTTKGFLKLCELTDLDSDDSPLANDAKEIKSFQKSPSLDRNIFLRKVML